MYVEQICADLRLFMIPQSDLLISGVQNDALLKNKNATGGELKAVFKGLQALGSDVSPDAMLMSPAPIEVSHTTGEATLFDREEVVNYTFAQRRASEICGARFYLPLPKSVLEDIVGRGGAAAIGRVTQEVTIGYRRSETFNIINDQESETDEPNFDIEQITTLIRKDDLGTKPKVMEAKIDSYIAVESTNTSADIFRYHRTYDGKATPESREYYVLDTSKDRVGYYNALAHANRRLHTESGYQILEGLNIHQLEVAVAGLELAFAVYL